MWHIFSVASSDKTSFLLLSYENTTISHFQDLPLLGKAFTLVPIDVLACLPFGITVCLDPFAMFWDGNKCWFLEIFDSLEKSKQKKKICILNIQFIKIKLSRHKPTPETISMTFKKK